MIAEAAKVGQSVPGVTATTWITMTEMATASGPSGHAATGTAVSAHDATVIATDPHIFL